MHTIASHVARDLEYLAREIVAGIVRIIRNRVLPRVSVLFRKLQARIQPLDMEIYAGYNSCIYDRTSTTVLPRIFYSYLLIHIKNLDV